MREGRSLCVCKNVALRAQQEFFLFVRLEVPNMTRASKFPTDLHFRKRFTQIDVTDGSRDGRAVPRARFSQISFGAVGVGQEMLAPFRKKIAIQREGPF